MGKEYYLALDVGSKTIGLASSHGIIASSKGVIRFDELDFNSAVNQLISIINQEKYSHIIVGYPKNMDNSIGHRAKMVDQFIELLSAQIDSNIKIVKIDERLTTRLSNQIMLEANLSRKKRKENKDSLAAQLILETYLNSINNS